MTKFFKKSKKTLFWDHFGHFLAKFGEKMDFLGKKGRQFLNIPIIYHHAKNQKKLMTHS